MQEKPLVIIIFLLALNLTGCNTTNSSSTKVRYYDWSGLDAQLPNGTNSTPAHNLPRYEYPFDSKGKVHSSWAAERTNVSGPDPQPTEAPQENVHPETLAQ